MPIHVGGGQRFDQNVDDELEEGDGEAIFRLLGEQLREMSPGEQLEVVTALQGEGWSALRPDLRARFDKLTADFLEGGPPE